jgi:hypothetical protein
MLEIKDVLYTILHYLVIGLNVLLWIPKRTRTLHLIAISATLFSWIVLGFWSGFGYCFLTDWHWDVKRLLGEQNLPGSFIHYQLVNVLGLTIDPKVTDWVTAVVFVLVILIALWQHLLAAKLRRYIH